MNKIAFNDISGLEIQLELFIKKNIMVLFY
jgi:hypothetical protein